MVTQERRREAQLVPSPRVRGRDGENVLDRAARSAGLAVLRRIRSGELTVVDGAETHRFGSARGPEPLRATVTVHRPGFYRALLRGGSRAMALSHIEGDWDCDDAVALTRLSIRNLHFLDSLRGLAAPLVNPVQRGLRWFDRNTPARSVRRVRQHYDLGNDFYALMLTPR